jgi:hypothetical protein
MNETAVALQRTLSTERLAPYLEHSDGDFDRALAVYEDNLKASEAFHTPLHSVEIALRNTVDAAMLNRYGPGWYGDVSLLNGGAIEEVETARTKVVKVSPVKAHGSLVAELSFGFWVSLLAPQYDATLWRQALYCVFTRSGRPLRRDHVYGRFNMVRRFRNRVAHHEPIWNHKDLSDVYGEIIEAIGWMCPHTAQWTAELSRVPDVVGDTAEL